MSTEKLISNLRDKLKHQDDQICELREKLIKFNTVVANKDELQKQLTDLKQWMESVEFRESQINNDLLDEINFQSLKLEKAKTEYTMSRTEINRLLELNEHMNIQIDKQKQNEQKLIFDIKELEITQKRIRNELCDAKLQVQEKCFTIENLTKTLKCKDHENVCIRRQLDECRLVSDRLNDVCRHLEKELDCKKSELANVKSHAHLMATNIQLEKEAMLQEIKISCQKFRDKETEYNELSCNVDDMKLNVYQLETLVKELQMTCEANRCEIQRLKKESSTNDEYVCLMKSKIARLTRENKCMSLENNALKTQTDVERCILEKKKHATENLNRLEQENNALLCTVQQQKNKIDHLEKAMCCLLERELNNERETCRLREEINRPEMINEHEARCLRKKIEEPEKCLQTNEREDYCMQDKINEILSKNKPCSQTKHECECSRNINSHDNKYLYNNLKKLHSELEQIKTNTET